MTSSAKRFRTKPPANLAGWMREFPIESLPVLQTSVFELKGLREFEEQVDLQKRDDPVSSDPLLTAQLFGFIAKRRGLVVLLRAPPWRRGWRSSVWR